MLSSLSLHFSFQSIILMYAENSGVEVTGSTLFSYAMPLTLLAVYSALSYLCILPKPRGRKKVDGARQSPTCFFPNAAGSTDLKKMLYYPGASDNFTQKNGPLLGNWISTCRALLLIFLTSLALKSTVVRFYPSFVF